MKRVPKLLEPTPEGRIVAALIKGAMSFSKLKAETRLSDRWLSRKLKELTSMGIVEARENSYRLVNIAEILADPLFAKYIEEGVQLREKAKLIAQELSADEQVCTVLLFGSVAKEKATEESDLDLVVVTEKEIEEKLNKRIYDLMFKYNVAIEAVFLTIEELIINLQSRTTFSFQVLEAYQVLYDKIGIEHLLHLKQKELREQWIYDEEAAAWIQKKLIPTSR
ncbi:MAG: nucleotidyltransferase domain-containing protein [Halobacteria archaeon]